MSVDRPNAKDENEAIAAKLKSMGDRAAQQPVSYLPLFREAMDLAEEQFKRAMTAEARLFRISQ